MDIPIQPVKDIPVCLESQETFVFLGFNEKTAAEHWRAWENFQTFPIQYYDFPQFAMMKIEQTVIDASGSEDWLYPMHILGIAQELRDAIMNPEFEEYRLTESLQYWIKHVFELRYDTLERIHDGAGGLVDYYCGTRKRADRWTQVRTDSGVDVADLPSATNGVQSDDNSGTIVLWKGVSIKHCESMKQHIARGELHFDDMKSTGQTDFHKTKAALYLNTDRTVADLYIHYMRCCNPLGSMRVMRVTIPKKLIAELNPKIMDALSEEWKCLVWASRHSSSAKKAFYSEEENLLIGPISKSHTKPIWKMKSSEEMDACNVMQLKSRDPWLQYAFLCSDEVIKDTLENKENGVEVELFYPNGELWV